jgi:ABC-type transport system involved in cytochrome c biogenesis permease subunit
MAGLAAPSVASLAGPALGVFFYWLNMRFKEVVQQALVGAHFL